MPRSLGNLGYLFLGSLLALGLGFVGGLGLTKALTGLCNLLENSQVVIDESRWSTRLAATVPIYVQCCPTFDS